MMLTDALFYVAGVVLTGIGYYVLGRLGRRAWDRVVKERRL